MCIGRTQDGWWDLSFRRWVAVAAAVAALLAAGALAWYGWTSQTAYPRDPSVFLIVPALAIPLIFLVLYLRRPYDSRSVPRDAMAVRGKAKLPRTLGVVPNQALDDKIRDEAADQPKSQKPD